MFDQLIIGTLASYDDFEASVRERKESPPEKKVIKETVPFSNETYDFTAIDGEIYWTERKLEYIFEIDADTAEGLEVKKTRFKSWIMNVMQEELHDPFITDYHFIATFESIDIDDSEVEKSTIAVSFTAYPYMIANEKTVYTAQLIAGKETKLNVVNNSAHRLSPTFTSDVNLTMKVGEDSFAIPAGTITDKKFKLAVGFTTLTLKPIDAAGVFKIEFYNEVL